MVLEASAHDDKKNKNGRENIKPLSSHPQLDLSTTPIPPLEPTNKGDLARHLSCRDEHMHTVLEKRDPLASPLNATNAGKKYDDQDRWRRKCSTRRESEEVTAVHECENTEHQSVRGEQKMVLGH